MQLTLSEKKLFSLETSYRVQRACCTTFAVFCALPLLFGFGLIAVSLVRGHSHIDILTREMLDTDWSPMFPNLTTLLLFCFLGYRADSKLAIIAHLKHHLESERNEPGAAIKSGHIKSVGDSGAAAIGERSLDGSGSANMNTHQVTLNGEAVAIGRNHFRLVTMVRSIVYQDSDANKVTAHELAMEGFDAFGALVTKFIPGVPLKKGDAIQILIGETHES